MTKVLVVRFVGAVLWGSCVTSGADFYDEGVMPVVQLQFFQANRYSLLQSNSVDYTLPDQRLTDYKTLNLLNHNSGATFMREVLCSNTCRRQVPSAKANFVRLKINAQLPDVIELKNISDQPISLAGDQSCGRYPDGVGLMRVFSGPTPLGPNTGSLVIEDD